MSTQNHPELTIFSSDAKADLQTTIDSLPHTSDPNATLQAGLNFAYGVAGIVAVIIIIVAGVQYITSTGDPNKTSKATRAIIYAAIGLGVVILAAIITNFLIGTISSTGP